MSGTNETRVVDPETGGAKGRKDERFDLFPFDALEEVALVYGFGAKKYDDNNWLKGYAWRLSLGALLRHVARWACGEDNDQETGLSHMAHAAWHCLTLITFAKRKLGKDDRAPSFVRPREIRGSTASAGAHKFRVGDLVNVNSPMSTLHGRNGQVSRISALAHPDWPEEEKPLYEVIFGSGTFRFSEHELEPYNNLADYDCGEKPSGAV